MEKSLVASESVSIFNRLLHYQRFNVTRIYFVDVLIISHIFSSFSVLIGDLWIHHHSSLFQYFPFSLELLVTSTAFCKGQGDGFRCSAVMNPYDRTFSYSGNLNLSHVRLS